MDRFTWYVETLSGDGLQAGPVYVLDKDYALPGKVRVHAKRAPDRAPLRVDIKSGGVSVFPASSVPALQKTRNLEEDWDSFRTNNLRLERFTTLQLDVLDSGGAQGITVSLELEEAAGGSYRSRV